MNRLSFFIVIFALIASSASAQRSIRSGEIWPDDNGEHINAHGGGVMKYGDTYYWFGEHKSEHTSDALVGVMCYASKDLLNWRNCGVALSVSNEKGHDIEKGCILERPKVIYNPVTKKFCMWFHLELKGQGYNAARYGVAVADRPEGPYKFLYSSRANAGIWPIEGSPMNFNEYLKRDFGTGQMARDMTLFVDDDGKAYHIFSSEENFTLHIAELTADYLHHTGHYTRMAPGGQNEAPAIFKKDGTYWMITSGCTGWAPNEARMFSAPSIWGPWTQHPNPCRGPKAEKTFNGQSTFILPVNGQYIFMADIWHPNHPSDARYIWLPIEFEDEKPVINWRDEWKAEHRADQLLKQLTLEEKVKLMMDASPAIDRLQIPQFQWWNEALHGVGRNGYATVFPITTAMAASWDDALLHRVFTAVSDEARVKARQAKQSGKISRYQSLSFWTPNINIFRDPRWGRGQETYGEDPFLTSKMGLAVVRGLQGYSYDGKPLSRHKKLLACAKHFAVHSGPEWNRHTFNIESLPERDLWETYLPAFKSLVQEGDVAEVMCAYQRIDGQPCCSQTRYEQQILRDEWGFKGLITSDCGAIRDFLPRWHNTAKDSPEAAAQAVLAGTDVECGSEYRNLPEAVHRGDIKEADLDRSLRRLLIARFEVGDFDNDDLVSWTKIPASVVASKAHKQLALDMARKSIVLLKNNGVLPLNSSLFTLHSSLIVMGPNANDSVMQWGNYSGYPTKTVTALEGIRQLLGNVPYVQGCGVTRNESIESRFSEIKAPLGNQGMQAIFYNDTEMKGKPVATITLTEPIKLSNGGNTVFAPGVNLENFSARLDGTFIPTRNEKLIFSISGDDKIRLLVNGDTLVDIWKVRHRIQKGEKELAVKAGEHYRIQIDYVQETGYGSLNFDIQHKTVPTRQELLSQVGNAETVIFVGGISPSLEGEEMKVSEPGFRGGDRTSIELPQVQRDVLRWLHEAGKKVVFVNCSGGAVAMTPELETCDAIVQWWYGGEQGGTALAEVLTGRYNPSGKLPVTFYRSTDDLPDFLDYTMKNRTYRYFTGKPLFPFGHGLSYTTFKFSKPTVNIKGHDITLNVTVKNTGKMEGTETVQVYFRRPADKEGPLKTLCAYQQVTLKAGEARTVTINLSHKDLESWDAQTNTMRFVPGQYLLMVGPSSDDNTLLNINTKI